MKIIVGLGNPGAEYAGTRHNAGMMLVERLAASVQRLEDYGWRKFFGIYAYRTPEMVLAKTANYFMNESGRMIYDLRFMNYELSDVYIAHDDLDLKLGEYKVQFGKGPKEHNGVKSVEQALGTKEFWRIRIGVDNRQTPVAGETYVLEKFLPEEREVVESLMVKIAESFITPPHSPS